MTLFRGRVTDVLMMDRYDVFYFLSVKFGKQRPSETAVGASQFPRGLGQASSARPRPQFPRSYYIKG